jgi:hypothetical protein
LPEIVLYVAAVWTTVLLATSVLAVIRVRPTAGRILIPRHRDARPGALLALL